MKKATMKVSTFLLFLLTTASLAWAEDAPPVQVEAPPPAEAQQAPPQAAPQWVNGFRQADPTNPGDALAIQTYQETGAPVQWHMDLGEGTKVFTNQAEADAYSQQRWQAIEAETAAKAAASDSLAFVNGKPVGSERALKDWHESTDPAAIQAAQLREMELHKKEMAQIKAEQVENYKRAIGNIPEGTPEHAEAMQYLKNIESGTDAITEEGIRGIQEATQEKLKQAERIKQEIYRPRVLISTEANKEAQGGDAK